jgi:D-amino-acid oxidase
VYPVRGQTLLLRAPWIREGHTLTTDKGQRVYTVPRKSGNVSTRTFVQHNHPCFPSSFWSAARETPTTGKDQALFYAAEATEHPRRYPHPRPETTRSILAGVLKLAPDIVPPRLRANPDSPPQVEDAQALIIEEGCGFRPARHGGIRLSVDWIPTGPTAEKKIPVVFHYGYVTHAVVLQAVHP